MATPTLSKHSVPGALGQILIDIRAGGRTSARPAVVVLHGFKGFKDWGMFPPLTERLAQYEPEVRHEGHDRGSASPPPAASYSVDAETKRRQHRKRRRKKSPGRRPTELKFANADRYEDVYPPRVRRADCQLVRERAVWRLPA